MAAATKQGQHDSNGISISITVIMAVFGQRGEVDGSATSNPLFVVVDGVCGAFGWAPREAHSWVHPVAAAQAGAGGCSSNKQRNGGTGGGQANWTGAACCGRAWRWEMFVERMVCRAGLAGRDGHVTSGEVTMVVVVAGYSRRLRGRGRLPRWAHDDGRAEAQGKTRAGEAVAVRKEGGKPHGQRGG